jgi:glycosyltransferase involved in cell wall biosynthesis
MIKIPTLSFCITCKNRFYQIAETLRKNLEDNRLHMDLIEFILVDFGSTDGLRDWIISDFIDDLKSGFLKYYYTDKLSIWNAPVSKNTSHFCANNDIVVNLDCDNYVGFLGGQYVIRHFIENRNIVLHQFSGDYYDGSHGRIALLREYFEFIGGYDEALDRLGYEDMDLISRLKAINLKYILSQNKRFNGAIKNPRPDGFEEMNVSNSKKSQENIKKGNIIVNKRFYGIRNNLYDYKGNLFKKDYN